MKDRFEDDIKDAMHEFFETLECFHDRQGLTGTLYPRHLSKGHPESYYLNRDYIKLPDSIFPESGEVLHPIDYADNIGHDPYILMMRDLHIDNVIIGLNMIGIDAENRVAGNKCIVRISKASFECYLEDKQSVRDAIEAIELLIPETDIKSTTLV